MTTSNIVYIIHIPQARHRLRRGKMNIHYSKEFDHHASNGNSNKRHISLSFGVFIYLKMTQELLRYSRSF